LALSTIKLDIFINTVLDSEVYMLAPRLLFIKSFNFKKENALILYMYVNNAFSDCLSSVKRCFPMVTYDGGR